MPIILFHFLFKLYTFCQSVAKLTLLSFAITTTIMKFFLLSIFTFLLGSNALAEQPKNWQLGYQKSVTSVMDDLVFMHDYILLPIITAISVFVLFLILYAVWKFKASKNPNPTKTSHNTLLEVLWTVIPCLILVVIAIPSFKLLYKQDVIPKADITIKAIGYQWYWGYEYPQHDIVFDSFMLAEDELAEYGYTRDEYLLATNTAMVVPTGRDVVVQVTGADVIHSWTIPAFGVKQDGIPGRLAQLWFNVEPGREGIYFGQCSELCGVNHAYMPITVFAVTPEEYDAWTRGEISDFASVDARAPQVVELAAAQ